MKHFFVINNHSFYNQESLKQLIADIENCFSGSMDYKVHITRYPRDAIAAVHRYISNCPKDEIVRVYAVGGDGILFECLNGMVDFPNAELTSVPYGNANDFVLAFGDNAMESFRDIKKLSVSPSRPVDIIHCGSNYAIIQANIGIIGQTIINANQLFPHLPDKWLHKNASFAYSICALWALFNSEVMQQRYTILLDGEDFSDQYCNIHIANGPRNGGGLLPNPYAKPDSGFMQVIMAKTNRKLDFIRVIGDYNKGHFEKHKFFIHKRCRTVEVKSDVLLKVEMDGEGFYAKELKMELIPGGIKFFAPEGMDFFDYSHRAYKGASKDGSNQ